MSARSLLRGEPPCFVYVAVPADPDRFRPAKVGISRSPGGRLAELQTACPFRLTMPWRWRFPDRALALEVEQRFHREHARWRTSGEWFDLDCVGVACSVDETAIEVLLDRGFGVDDLPAWAAYMGMSAEHLHDLLLSMGVA